MKVKKTNSKVGVKKGPGVGARIIEGLEEAVAWSKGENVAVRVTRIQIPDINVSEVRHRMGLSQSQFATKFGSRLQHFETGSRGEPPGCADACAVGRNRKTPGKRRRCAEGPSMTYSYYGQYYGHPLQVSISTRCSRAR
jgi:putative transcriptional regulator